MIRVGIAGLGFMGKMHFRCYKTIEDAQIVAICDIDENKFSNVSGTAGNIAGAEQPLDFSGIKLYTDFKKMIRREKLDALSVTLPTPLHAEYTNKALKAGINVLCEKPMAIDIKKAKSMVAAAEKFGKILQIGHCVRFWPEYAETKKIIDSGKYGKIYAATFQRLSATPTWSWNNWIMDGSQSGGALTDLHIHDSDYIQYLFGMPQKVSAHGIKGPSGEFDHVVTSYLYDDGKVVTAEGGWVMTTGFGFEMSFNIVLEKATIIYDCTRQPAFKVCPAEGGSYTPEVESGDGYSLEIAHFVKKVSGRQVPQVTTPKQSLDSIRIITAERKSAQTRKEAMVR